MELDTFVLFVIAITCTIGCIVFQWLKNSSKPRPNKKYPPLKVFNKNLSTASSSNVDEYHSLSMELSALTGISVENLNISGNIYALRLRVEQLKHKIKRKANPDRNSSVEATPNTTRYKHTPQKSTSKTDEYEALSMELSKLLGISINETCLSDDVDSLRLRVEKVRRRLENSIGVSPSKAAMIKQDVLDFKDLEQFSEYMTSVMYEFPHIEFLVKVTKCNDAYIFSIKLPKTNLNTALRLRIRRNGVFSLDLNSNLYSNFKSLSERYHEKTQPMVKEYKGAQRVVHSPREPEKLYSNQAQEEEIVKAYHISKYIIEGNILEIRYLDRAGDVTRRRVRVLEVIEYKNGKKSFSAHCYLRGAKRTFLVSGIQSLVPKNNSYHKSLESKKGASVWMEKESSMNRDKKQYSGRGGFLSRQKAWHREHLKKQAGQRVDAAGAEKNEGSMQQPDDDLPF